MKKVLVGMSGGVDSTAAVLLLQKAGYEVSGLTLWLCGGDEGAKEAAALAKSLGVSHTVLDMRQTFFEKVQVPFRDAYLGGKTPNPCVKCNTEIKFAALRAFADERDIPYIATGHYAKICEKDGKQMFSLAADAKKDQTYFLTQVPTSIPERLLLPLGDYTKEEVRAIAGDAALSVSKKADSQEICFIPDNDYISYLETAFFVPKTEGKIIDENGFTVGFHDGIYRYTIGQRKGLGAFGRKVFVTGLCAADNTVSIGENAALFKKGLLADALNIFDDIEGTVSVKVRSAAPITPGICKVENGVAQITFDVPQRAVTPGQAVAIYKNDVLVGGGTIMNAF